MNRFYLLLATVLAVQISLAQNRSLFDTALVSPRMRVIMDNDFSGDPDGLFALAHLALSPSVDLRGVIGSHLNAQDGFDRSAKQAENAAANARALLAQMGKETLVRVYTGSNKAMANEQTPVASEGVDFLIREARRTDTKLPLYLLCGAGLTEVASALLKAPDIADRFTLVWIGGPEHPGLALPPPGASSPEYNLNIDLSAGRVVFNKAKVKLWQVPRNAYRQAPFSYAELLTRVKPQGRLGAYLTGLLENVMQRIHPFYNTGEVYILGDSPLVLLTALQSSFEADPASSDYVVRACPQISPKGDYLPRPGGRPIRVYTRLDTRLMFEDFVAKLQLFSK